MLILFTDFAYNSPYVGQMKLAAAKIAPELRIIDLLHDAPTFDPRSAAYLLAALSCDLPTCCGVVAVVDPGVGSRRDGLIVQADERLYVAPDNGLLERIVAGAKLVKCWRITWRPYYLSASFHGRDLFVPLAARLLTGEQRPEQVGSPIDFPTRGWPEQLAQIIYIDSYGNAMTGLQANKLDKQTKLQVDGETLNYARTFAEAPVGQGFWYENSLGLVEIAVNQGCAAKQFDLRVGKTVQMMD